MKSRFAALLMLGVLAAIAGCPAAPTTTGADETRTSSTKKSAKPKAPAASKAPGTGATTGPGAGASASPAAGASASPTAVPSGSPGPSASPTGAAPSASPSAGATTSPSPSPSATTSPAGDQASAAVTVLINGMAFEPAQVTVKQGGRVTFINRSTSTHTIQPDGHAAFSGSESLAPPVAPAVDGGKVEIDFADVGTFAYFCGIHTGMTGTVVVVP